MSRLKAAMSAISVEPADDLLIRTPMLNGPSIGFNVMENAWISLGYNFAGFKDRDFSAANYTAEGPYVQFRFKFDQNSVKEGLKMMGR